MAKKLDFKRVKIGTGNKPLDVAAVKAKLVALKAVTSPSESDRQEINVFLPLVDDILDRIEALEATATYLTTAGHTNLAAKFTGIATELKAVLTELEAAVGAVDEEIVAS